MLGSISALSLVKNKTKNPSTRKYSLNVNGCPGWLGTITEISVFSLLLLWQSFYFNNLLLTSIISPHPTPKFLLLWFVTLWRQLSERGWQAGAGGRERAGGCFDWEESANASSGLPPAPWQLGLWRSFHGGEREERNRLYMCQRWEQGMRRLRPLTASGDL